MRDNVFFLPKLGQLFCWQTQVWISLALGNSYRAFSLPKQWNRGHVCVPKQSCGSWTLFLCKHFCWVFVTYFVHTISDKIVDTFTLLIPYFITVIHFCSLSLSFRPPLPLNNVEWHFLWSWATNKQHWMGERGIFYSLLRDKKSGVFLVH